MDVYTKENAKELVHYLRASFFHDASFAELSYSKEHKNLTVQLVNDIYNKTICLMCKGVHIFLSIDSDRWGKDETILGLTVADDYLLFSTFLLQYELNIDNSIHLCFQMFSGNEIHIVCEEVTFSTQ